MQRERIKKIYKHIISTKTRIEILYLINRIKGLFLRGNKYYCNYCEKGFRKFLSKGNIQRENAMCPNCMSLERTRLLLEYLKNETSIFSKNLNVLHFAPERCLFNLLKKQNINYVDGDINPLLASEVIDITNIQYPDNSFDLIICSHVLGHIPDEKAALKELHRVLAQKGELILMSLIDFTLKITLEDVKIKTATERLKYYGESDLERLYGGDIIERLQNGGFVVEKIDYRLKVDKKLSEKLNLGDGSREMIYKCTKH